MTRRRALASLTSCLYVYCAQTQFPETMYCSIVRYNSVSTCIRVPVVVRVRVFKGLPSCYFEKHSIISSGWKCILEVKLVIISQQVASLTGSPNSWRHSATRLPRAELHWHASQFNPNSPGHLQVFHCPNVYIMRHIFTSRKDLAICSFTTFFTLSPVSNCMSSWPYQTLSISDSTHGSRESTLLHTLCTCPCPDQGRIWNFLSVRNLYMKKKIY